MFQKIQEMHITIKIGNREIEFDTTWQRGTSVKKLIPIDMILRIAWGAPLYLTWRNRNLTNRIASSNSIIQSILFSIIRRLQRVCVYI
jgi:hypothetical protein